MAALTPCSKRTPRASQPGQGGYVLLLTLITLLVLLFGVLFTMRGTLLQTIMTGNTAQRQKDVQAGDLALRLMQQKIITSSVNAGDVPLDISAANEPWFFTPGGTAPWPLPGNANATAPANANADYWAVCSATNTSKPCWQMTGLPSGYSAKAVVVPTNLPPSDSACQDGGQRIATYYDIFIHIAEANGRTAATTDTVFKLCTPSQS